MSLLAGPARGSGAGMAAWLLLLPLRLLATGLGRRLATVMVLTTLFVAVMSVLYEHADRPTANARPAASTVAAPAAPGRSAAAAAAASWYARRLGVPAARVRALGSQRLGPGRLRVLVLAEEGGRRPTAWVTVRRTHGGWTVTS